MHACALFGSNKAIIVKSVITFAGFNLRILRWTKYTVYLVIVQYNEFTYNIFYQLNFHGGFDPHLTKSHIIYKNHLKHSFDTLRAWCSKITYVNKITQTTGMAFNGACPPCFCKAFGSEMKTGYTVLSKTYA